MVVVGLTGGVASGKSTVVSMFAEEGARVIDVDELSRVVVEPGRPAWHEIIAFFGREVLREDGALDRRRLGHIVFSDTRKRRELEQIVHPRVLEEYEKRLSLIREKTNQAIVIADVPLLMEVELEARFDRVIVVYAPPKSQKERLIKRDGLTEQAALERLTTQMPIEEKARRADSVIDNSGSLEETRRQVRRVYQGLKELEKDKQKGTRRGT
jgi:dephospho-CoA kinase